LGLIQGISCLFIESAIGLFQGCSLHAFLLLRKPGQVQRIPAAEIPPPRKARHPHLRLHLRLRLHPRPALHPQRQRRRRLLQSLQRIRQVSRTGLKFVVRA